MPHHEVLAPLALHMEPVHRPKDMRLVLSKFGGRLGLFEPAYLKRFCLASISARHKDDISFALISSISSCPYPGNSLAP